MTKRSPFRLLAVALAPMLLAACGGSSSGTSYPPGYYITLGPMSFSPANLAAPSGATVTVVNNSGYTHSVTQEAAAGDYVLGAPTGMTPFDTGLFGSGTKTFTLPTGLADGTVLYYFCRNHMGAMTPPNGTITITATAPPGGGGGGGGGGGY